MLSWIIFAILGKLLIFFWMKFPLSQHLENTRFIGGLHECGLCSGFWVFTALSVLLRIDLLTLWFGFFYIPVVSEVITGAVTSYIVHLISLGFAEQHLNVTVI
jgi:hypothetical protein